MLWGQARFAGIVFHVTNTPRDFIGVVQVHFPTILGPRCRQSVVGQDVSGQRMEASLAQSARGRAFAKPDHLLGETILPAKHDVDMVRQQGQRVHRDLVFANVRADRQADGVNLVEEDEMSFEMERASQRRRISI